MNPRLVDYYFTPVSPWSYLGHARLVEIARRHRATIAVKPIDLGRVFPASGGLPLKDRAPQRQAYRIVELARWSKYLGIALNPRPAHFPVRADLASRWILAALEQGTDAALDLALAFGRALWAEERDIAAHDTLAAIASGQRLDVAALDERANAPDIATRYAVLTQEAIDRGVFGAPTYVVGGEMFWGQDRLDFLDRELAK
ncbi:MAG TPA: 2-hydroxychromene-2-carboxylate isomerase [Casimicrobiaceae bacterium]|jgi:2-hydroxychromene-2-carboxylate isomerase|nr:2-hydroxychromene-2-carboxylate isomerase [Casimicrobiaceae bacterium]